MADNKINGDADRKLDALFKSASKEEWIPLDGFDERVVAGIERKRRMPLDPGALAWRILPFTAAVSVAIIIIASFGESIESLVYGAISIPFSVEGLMILLG